MNAAGAASAPVSGPVQLALFGPAAAVEVPARPAPPVAPVEKAPAAPASRGGWVRRWSVTSRTHPEVVYVVAQREDGRVGCSCKGWVFHAHRPTCKHIAAVRAQAGGEVA